MPQREQNDRGSGALLRAQLVAAASDLLLSPQALAAPSLRAVARACDVSPAAVYLHFDSQQALIGAVVDEQFAALSRFIRSAVDDGADDDDRLRMFALAYAEWGTTHPGGYQLLFETADRLGVPEHDVPEQDVPEQDDEERWDLLREAADLLVALGAAQDEGAAHARALDLWTDLHGIVSLRIHKRDVVWPTSRDDDVRRSLHRHLDRPGQREWKSAGTSPVTRIGGTPE